MRRRLGTLAGTSCGVALVVGGWLLRRMEFAEPEPRREPHVGIDIDLAPILVPALGLMMIVVGAIVAVSVVATTLAFPRRPEPPPPPSPPPPDLPRARAREVGRDRPS